MKKLIPGFLAFILAGSAWAVPAPTPAAIPTVLSTDIGSDIDDIWALAQLLRTPGLDLRFVLTETGESDYRARVAAKLLETAGRSDVAVGLGLDAGPMEEKDRFQSHWIEGYDLSQYAGTIHRNGVEALAKWLTDTPGPINVIAIGPVPSLAAAIAKVPGALARCRFIGMHGSFAVGYGGSSQPVAETNVRLAPAALRQVLAAPWKEILLTPLDTCGLLHLDGELYHSIWSATGDPLLRAVIHNYCLFAPRVTWMRVDYFTIASTTLFDSAAVTLAVDESYFEIEPVPFRITDDGYTVRDEAGPHRARVALHWRDMPRFQRDLTAHLLAR